MFDLNGYFIKHIEEIPGKYINKDSSLVVCDYISGMTDLYALETHKQLFSI